MGIGRKCRMYKLVTFKTVDGKSCIEGELIKEFHIKDGRLIYLSQDNIRCNRELCKYDEVWIDDMELCGTE
jgi:hypothetical protein